MRLEGHAQPREQLAAVGGRGGEDERWHAAALRIAFEKQWLRPKSGFDLGGLDTYYTRPMSGPREMAPWSKPLEVDRLAESQADLDYEIQLAELPGLRSLRGGVAGKVAGAGALRAPARVPRWRS